MYKIRKFDNNKTYPQILDYRMSRNFSDIFVDIYTASKVKIFLVKDLAIFLNLRNISSIL